jgi:hypothetical protein
MSLFVTFTYSARWSSESGGLALARFGSLGCARFGSLAFRGPAVTLARGAPVRGSATTSESSVVVLFALDERCPKRPVTLA